MKTVKQHWAEVEKIREKTGKLPENAFDFISIHSNDFSLIVPMKLRRPNRERLLCEKRKFKTLNDSVDYCERYIKRLAKLGYSLEIVTCF